MDILQLVDRLEELFNQSRPIPLTNNVIVDEDKMLDLIDQMRVAIPDEVKKAQKLIAERDRTLASATEEAQRTLQLAKEKSAGMVERDSIVASAEDRAKDILRQAGLDADATRQEADDYVIEVLTNLEMELERILNQVRNGIRAVIQQQEEKKTAAGAASPEKTSIE
jgi:hypothetical protein